MERKAGLVAAFKGLNNNIKLDFKEAYVISVTPLELQCTTDNGLVISDSNLFPIGNRFGTQRKKAVIYYNNEEDTTPKEIEIEINNDININDLFLVIEVDNGETCRYILLDKL
ncbi:MAG: hypothetical protein Q4D26_09635 [Clostridia bacterium]|nr:hypothetical protein [Clostridia bacterium]